VPLSSLVKLVPTTGPSLINRLARQRQVTITANVAPGVGQSEVSDALIKIINEQHLPPQYHAAPAGLTKETGRAVRGFAMASSCTSSWQRSSGPGCTRSPSCCRSH
jgi:HAE1 family hydrophobic/amphiphilic exporter-1